MRSSGSSRRSFLSMLAASSAAPLVSAPLLAAMAHAAAQNPSDTSAETDVDQETRRFWMQDIRNPTARGTTRGSASTGVDEGAHPEFTIYKPDSGFRPPNKVQDAELLDKGNVSVTLRVLAFKASKADEQHFKNIQTGSLRIDFQQTAAQKAGTDPLVWSAFGAVQPSSTGALPALQSTSFNPGTVWGSQQSVPLPGGAGLWGWNFFIQKKESLWCSLISTILKDAAIVGPVMGFPALAVQAMNTFNQFFGTVVTQAYKSKFLFQTVSDPTFATKDARQDAAYTDGLPLVNQSHYVIVRRDQLPAFGNEMDKHELQNGVIVPQGTKAAEVFEAAKDALPDITYLTLALSVKPDTTQLT